VLPWLGASLWRFAGPPNHFQSESHVTAYLLRKMAVRMWGPNELRIWQSTATWSARPLMQRSAAPDVWWGQKSGAPCRRQCAPRNSRRHSRPTSQWPSHAHRIAMIGLKIAPDLTGGWGYRGRGLLGEERFSVPPSNFLDTAKRRARTPQDAMHPEGLPRIRHSCLRGLAPPSGDCTVNVRLWRKVRTAACELRGQLAKPKQTPAKMLGACSAM
jgi:hypothetical protein